MFIKKGEHFYIPGSLLTIYFFFLFCEEESDQTLQSILELMFVSTFRS